MNEPALIDGLLSFVSILAMVTLHEFGHAWAAWKCGDDTARNEGRVTLNPAAHIDPLGTLLIPGLSILLGALGSSLGGFLIGWGRPVPVNLSKLRHRRRDDVLVSLAGPAMNVVLTLAALLVARLAMLAGWQSVASGFVFLATVSLYLCFFNLLPIPPLDGSRVARNLLGLSEEFFARACQFSLLLILIAIQIPFVQQGLARATSWSLVTMMGVLGF